MPLPEGKKKPPQEGFTGDTPEAMEVASDPELWSDAIRPFLEDAGFAKHNTGIRLPANVFALDVDEYRTKDAGAPKDGWNNLVSFAEEAGLGHPADTLPPTIRVTSRGYRGGSGQRFYRIPDSVQDVDAVMRQVPGVLVDGVEILRPMHRYTIEAGSLHPEGGVYRVYDERGGPGKRALPKGFGSLTPEEIPEIPDDWLRAIIASRPSVVAGEETAEGAESRAAAHDALESWINEHDLDVDDLTREDVLSLLTVGARRAVMSFGDPSRNNANIATACISLLATLMEDIGEDGTIPIRDAIEIAKHLYVSKGNKRDRPSEFDRALIWAFPNAKRMMAAPAGSKILEWAQEMVDDEFWGQSGVLRSCRDFARSRLVSPDAMLACALVIVASWLPPHLVLPGLVGDVAGLNFYVAIAGASGGGKSAAMKAAKAWLGVNPHEDSDLATDEPYTTTVATAQGLVQAYTVSVPKPKSEQIRPGEVEHIQVRRSVVFEVDEIGALGAAMNSEGSMLKDFIKTMWTGSGVGTTAAEATRIRKLEDHTFRMTIVAGVQPSTADVILSGHGDGFPQRWLWVEAFDEAPLEQDEWEAQLIDPPEPLGWTPPLAAHRLATGTPSLDSPAAKLVNAFTQASRPDTTLEIIDVTPSFRSKVYQAAAGSGRRIGDTDVAMSDVLDGHSVLLQEKLAALLAALHGRTNITPHFESIAERITAKSDATREAILHERHQESIKRMETDARRQGRSEALANEVRLNAEIEQFNQDILGELLKLEGKTTIQHLRRAFRLSRLGSRQEQVDAIESVPGVVVEGDKVILELGGEST